MENKGKPRSKATKDRAAKRVSASLPKKREEGKRGAGGSLGHTRRKTVGMLWDFRWKGISRSGKPGKDPDRKGRKYFCDLFYLSPFP